MKRKKKSRQKFKAVGFQLRAMMYFSHPSDRKDKYGSRDPSNQSSYSYLIDVGTVTVQE